MPKQTIRHSPGCALSTEIRSVLDQYFEEEEIRKFEILGGTVEFVLSTRHRGIKKKPKQVIDAKYIEKLRSIAESESDVKSELITLNSKQLREVCARLKLPISSQLTNRNLISSIEGKLLSQKRWRQIVDHQPQGASGD